MKQATYTEPLTIEEIAVFIGTHWRGAKAFVVNADGVQCGSQWQIPLSAMPPSYFIARCTSQHISALSCNATESPGASSQSGDNAGMKQLLTCKDTAIQLRLNLTDVNTLIESGELPYSVICGQVRISQSDIMEAVNRLRIDQKSLPALRTNECPL